MECESKRVIIELQEANIHISMILLSIIGIVMGGGFTDQRSTYIPSTILLQYTYFFLG
jgi:hypothetical protein